MREIMVKTTIEVDDDLWKLFSLLVLRERDERKKNEVIVELLKNYIEQEAYQPIHNNSNISCGSKMNEKPT